MSTEHHNPGTAAHGSPHASNGEPRNDSVAYELRDVQVRTIYWYLFSLAIATILSFIVAGFFQRGAEKMMLDAQPAALPMRKMMTEQDKMSSQYPPEPRLQGVPGHETDPQTDWYVKRTADRQANEQLRWIDQNSGIAQIPVSEAMKLIVANGVHGPGAAKQAELPKDHLMSSDSAKPAPMEKMN
jgi:hypothetical protein